MNTYIYSIDTYTTLITKDNTNILKTIKSKMNRTFIIKSIVLAAVSLFSLTACSSDSDSKKDTPVNPDPVEKAVFAKGADVSWLTEMEKSRKFYSPTGEEKECMALLKDLGANAIRLRVWVDPVGGWCAKQDVVTKAKRAQALGLRLMIDFHYSDSWADPSHQTPPAAWQTYDFAQMKQAVADHTTDVLQALKQAGVDVEWVQVGNETPDGFLWNDASTAAAKAVTGRASASARNFAAYELAGYNAVKEVYPEAKVIVHIDEGQKLDKYTWIFDLLKQNGGKWDVIGMSLYPEDGSWQTTVGSCLANIKTLVARYKTDVMICEIGMPWNSTQAQPMLKKMKEGCMEIPQCEGIFYWEPEVYNGWKPDVYNSLGWNAYDKGAFDNSGKPTAALKELYK